jgi:hypothetical protein
MGDSWNEMTQHGAGCQDGLQQSAAEFTANDRSRRRLDARYKYFGLGPGQLPHYRHVEAIAVVLPRFGYQAALYAAHR